MKEDGDAVDRRSVLKKSAILASATGFGSVGSAVAESGEPDENGRERTPENTGSASSQVELSMDNAMSRQEFDQYKSEMARKYGDEVVSQMDPGAAGDEVSTNQAAVDTQNLTWEASWNDEFDVEAGIGKLLETDHALTLYSGDETDNNGRRLYFFWQWSQSNAIDASYRTQTDTLRNHVSLTDSSDKLTDFDPATPQDVNGKWVDVGLSVGYGGITMGLNGQTYVKNGTVKPETGKVDTGSGGQYSVIFEGCQKGTTGLNGVIEARTDGWIFSSQVDWNLYASGTTVFNCW